MRLERAGSHSSHLRFPHIQVPSSQCTPQKAGRHQRGICSCSPASLHHEREGLQVIFVPQEPSLYIMRVSDRAPFTHIFRSSSGWYLSLSAMKMTLLSRSREAKTLTRCRTLREENRDSKSTCSSRESRGRHSSITCQGMVAAMRVGLVTRQGSWRQGKGTWSLAIEGGSSWKSTFVCPLDGPARKSCLLKACYC